VDANTTLKLLIGIKKYKTVARIKHGSAGTVVLGLQIAMQPCPCNRQVIATDERDVMFDERFGDSVLRWTVFNQGES
jgi:hypothetical protein